MLGPPRPLSTLHHAAPRRAAVRTRAADDTATIVQTLNDHFEHLDSDDVHVARLRTALKFYASAPRIRGFESPNNVAGAFQNACWRDKCHSLMGAVADRVPRESRSFLLLQQGRFAMRLDHRLPTPGDAARFFFGAQPGPKFLRDTVPLLEVFKTELAGLNVGTFDKPACDWLHNVCRAVRMYEITEHYVAKNDPVTRDVDLKTVGLAAYALHDVLEDPERPTAAALGNPRNFERTRAGLVDMCLLRIDDSQNELEDNDRPPTGA